MLGTNALTGPLDRCGGILFAFIQERTMAKPTAGDVLVETLIDWGVDTVFGIPGDGINGLI